VRIDRLPLLAALAMLALLTGSGRPAIAAPAGDHDLVAKGEYLAHAGDCIACHTNPGGVLFAGGFPMATPFGTIYSSNITPDPTTGIGSWTADQFYGAMHTGRFPDGGLIYPAMPFASYTKVTREDCDAIFAYLRSVPSVHQPNRPNDLRFPFNNRQLILGWRTLFFQEGEYQPDPTKSVEWNRGAYLVEGLGHCSMCHTPINALGGSSESQAFEGGLIPMQNWYAPSLTSNKEAGLGEWSIQEIVDLPHRGVASRRGIRPDGRSNVRQPAISERRRCARDGGLSEEFGPGQPVGTRAFRNSGPGEQSADELWPDSLYNALRELPRGGRTGHAPRLSAAGQQSVDPNGIVCKSDPHGSQRRVSARNGGQSDALRHAAFRADPFRRRGGGRSDLYPRRLGQSGLGCLCAPSQRTAHRSSGLIAR